MPRRWIQTGVAIVAIAGLGLVLYNATLVDRRPPSLSRVSLSATASGDDHVAQTLTAIDLVFSEPVDQLSVEQRFRIDPYVGGTFTWDRNTTAIFTPARKLPPATRFTVAVAAGFSDMAGNLAPGDTGPFEFQTVGPPVVASMLPATGTAGVATDTAVQVEFDRLMDTASVEAALTVVPAASFRVSWTGPSLTIVFQAPLAFGTIYTVTVGSDAADTDGSHLVAPYSGTFTTLAAGLGVDAVVPADGVAGIGVHSSIAILFDGSIDPASVAGALRITPAIGGDVRVTDRPTDVPVPPASSGGSVPPPAVPGQADPGSVVVFTPSGPLAEHTTYTVELAPVVRRAGDPGQVAAGRTWTFTTGGQTTSVQNQIAFLSARGGVRNVWLMNPDGTNPRQVTTELAPVSAYDVTSDGRTLVYAAGGVIRALRLESGAVSTLTGAGLLEYAPTVAPGGAVVLVGRRDATGADLGWWLEPLPDAPSGSAARQLWPTGAPPTGSSEVGGDGIVAGPGLSAWTGRAAFDPTSRWLVFVPPGGRVVHADRSPDESTPVVTELDIDAPTGQPAWDPVREGFVVAGSAAAGDGLLAMDADGGDVRLLFPATGPAAVDGHGGIATLVAPDGDHVGYTPLVSRPPQQLTSTPDLLDRSPGFSPDGTTLVFDRVLAADETRSAGIWLAGLDGRDLRQLSTDGTAARWVP
jgi:Bacterial Ig-like domain/WD40-like Beta Propeller Repeat